MRFRFVCVLVVFHAVSIAPLALAEISYTPTWIRQLGTSSSDSSVGVSVDGAGNVFISGNTTGSLASPNAGLNDAFVTKYDNSGNLLWSRQPGTTAEDLSYGVSADNAGNVYITGTTEGSLGGPNAGGVDAFVNKYDGSGNILWSRQFGSTTHDYAQGLRADSAGNVYVTGYTFGNLVGFNAGQTDAFLFKYDGSGNLVWKRQFGTSGGDNAYAVSSDTAGNVYVTGETTGSFGGPGTNSDDAFLAKFDSAGNILWKRQVGTPTIDSSTSVSTDAAGNVYISGFTRGSLAAPNAGNNDAFLIKYDGSGNLLWTRQLGTSGVDTSFGVLADSANNVYITGNSDGGLGGPGFGGSDAFLIKYDGSGNPLWGTQLGTNAVDGSSGIASDNAGDIFITGFTTGNLGGPNAGDDDAFVARFSGIPEPSCLAALAISSVLLLARRKQNHPNKTQ